MLSANLLSFPMLAFFIRSVLYSTRKLLASNQSPHFAFSISLGFSWTTASVSQIKSWSMQLFLNIQYREYADTVISTFRTTVISPPVLFNVGTRSYKPVTCESVYILFLSLFFPWEQPVRVMPPVPLVEFMSVQWSRWGSRKELAELLSLKKIKKVLSIIPFFLSWHTQ